MSDIEDSNSNKSESIEHAVAALKRKRAVQRGLLTKSYNYIQSSTINEASSCRLLVELEKVESCYNKFQEYEDGIAELEERNDDKLSEEIISFEDKYSEVKTKLKELLEKKGRRQSIAQPTTSNVLNAESITSTNNIKLPKLELPKFEGKYYEWLDFFNEYNSMVHNNSTLTNVEKFRYLKSCISGPARQIISKMEISESNYNVVYKALVKRYQNPSLIFQSHISEIFNSNFDGVNNSVKIRNILDITSSHVRALLSLGDKSNIADGILMHIMLSKVDRNVRLKWEEKSDTYITRENKMPTWENFLDFMENQASTLERFEGCAVTTFKGGDKDSKFKNNGYRSKNKNLSFFTKNSNCILCENSHAVNACPKFMALSPIDRYEEIKKLMACLICFKLGHGAKYCRAPRCEKCKSKHNTLLHFELDPKAKPYISKPPDDSNKIISNSSPGSSAAAFSTISSDNKVILATAVVVVTAASGLKIVCRAFLDSCSTDNFISSHLAKKLNLHIKKGYISVEGISSISTKSVGWCEINFSSRSGDYSHKINTYVVPKITNSYPPREFSIADFNIPNDIILADPIFNVSQSVDLLIGGELFWNIITGNNIYLGNGKPVLTSSKLGWIVGGSINSKIDSKSFAIVTTKLNSLNLNKECCVKLDKIVEAFWNIDKVPDITGDLKLKDEKCENHFIQNYSRDEKGKFIVKLPFAKNVEFLGNSYEIAKRRFLNLERKLSCHPELKIAYRKFIEEYINLDHCEVVKDFNSQNPHAFIPHHCVIKPLSSSTKLRVVFDASCRYDNGYSLNDFLMKGYKLQNDLQIVLLKFRTYLYAFTSDIQKMYRQVWVHAADTNFQLILWRSNESEELEILRLKTVTYGTKPGGFLATRCLFKLAEIEEKSFPIGAQIIREHSYVDDIFCGANTIEETIVKRQQVFELLQKGGFKLTKFCSNNSEVLNGISNEDKEKFLDIDGNMVIKILGLFWDPNVDKFRYSYLSDADEDRTLTKAEILSQLSKLFDPLGFICPVVTLGKIFFQELCKLKLKWNSVLDIELQKQWKRLKSQLQHVQDISIPRSLFLNKDVKKYQLHGFADASQTAYGACIYLRTLYEDGTTSVQLYYAKSRIAPIKKHTLNIPRLELQAALLLSQIVDMVKSNCLQDIKLDSTFCWSDSQIVLYWINSDAHEYETFVCNRIAKIQNLSKNHHWRHIDGKSNPADLISRGVLPADLKTSTLWFNGPDFLRSNQICWEPNFAKPFSDEEVLERRKHKGLVFLTYPIEDITSSMNYSVTFSGILRAFAYALRFIKNCRNPSLRKCHRKNLLNKIDYNKIELPTLSEVEAAEMKFIKVIQIKQFSSEYQNLIGANSVPKCSVVKSLAPFIDENGVMRVGGRLSKASVPYDAKYQILLPKVHKFTNSLFYYYHHLKLFHAGPQITLTTIRKKYWPVSGLQLARKISYNCVWCFRLRPRMLHQLMGDLPVPRLEQQKPFDISGVDFFGPVFVRHHTRCKASKKMYVALFICLVTKAVHMELVPDLTTNAFNRALKRFIADHGGVSKIFSDNAKNFKGAANQLKELQLNLQKSKSEIIATCQEAGVQWYFIPPRTPNFGGAWESMIKSAKRLMKSEIFTKQLTEDELRTIIRQCSTILNSRPITSLSSDPNDLEPLTPGHFLYGGSPTNYPDQDISSLELNQLKNYQKLTWIQQQYWKRWRNEYFQTLQPRTKWMFKTKNVKLNDMVLLKVDNAPSLKWPIGRIIKISDSDGEVRVVAVKTASGVYERGITNIALLPISDNAVC